MPEDLDDLSTFRKFIEAYLNLNALPDPPRERMHLGYLPDESHYATLPRDVRQVMDKLMQANPGRQYWVEYLTTFEKEVRGILQDEILIRVRRAFPETPTDQEMRSIIAFSMTLGWLVMNDLTEMYLADDSENSGDGDDVSDLDDFVF